MPRKKTSIDTVTEQSNEDLALQTTETVEDVAPKVEKPKKVEDVGVLDSQTLDMLKRVRDQKLVSGGRDPFFVPESDKDSKFSYRWASTDKDTPESIEYLKEIGWKEVEGYRTITTGGYTVHGQPGKHILMRLQKIVHDELVKIQEELNERKKSAVLGSEILMKDGGKNRMGSSTKKDGADFLNS